MGVTLANLFRNKVKSNVEAEPDVAYPTGFLTFDYLNGCVVHVESDGMDFTYDSVGIIDGSMVYAIGRAGCGKTTLLLQWAGNIVRPLNSLPFTMIISKVELQIQENSNCSRWTLTTSRSA